MYIHIQRTGPHKAGCGLAFFEDEWAPPQKASFGGPEYCTVFQMEVKAIEHAANKMAEMWEWNPYLSKEAFIMCDSQAAIKALDNPETKSQEVVDCKLALNRAGSLGKVTIRWIRAHVGYMGNELADEAAKEGALDPEAVLIESSIPWSFVKATIKATMIGNWNKAWQGLTTCRQTKIFFPRVDLAKSKKLRRAKKELYSRAVRWITGHNFLRRHNNITDYVDTARECRYCKIQEETSGHIITECEAFWRERRDCFSSFWLNPQSPNWTPEQLQAFLSATSVAWLEDDNSPVD